MATYTLTPEKVVRFDVNTGYIDAAATSQSQSISTDSKYNYLLAVFDMSQLTTYGEAVLDNRTTPALPVTWAKLPVCDKWDLTSYFFRELSNTDLSVGSIINVSEVSYTKRAFSLSYDSSVNAWVAGFAEYLVPGPENKLYVTLRYRAMVRTSETTYGGAPDNEFILSNLRLTLETNSDIAFTASSNYQGGYQDPAKPLTIKVSPNFNDRGVKQYSVANGTIYYKKTSESTYQSVSFIGTTGVIPANTFENGFDYDVYVRATADNGSTYDIPTVTLTTIDGTPQTAGIRPANEITYGTVDFQWSYSVSTGADQYAYDIQISSDNGSTWETIFNHVVSSETSATYEQSASGATLWRVRGYNQNDAPGAWSESQYYMNNVPPQAPTIVSIQGDGRQTVTWSADQQMAYEVKVLNSSGAEVFTTGEVYSTNKTALINEYLTNDNYTFMVRIAAGFGTWSSWATMSVLISAALPAPQVSASVTNEGVLITATPDAAYDHFYILKNGVPVAKTVEAYTDRFVNGTVTYRVVGVGENDAYGYSQVTVTYIPQSNCFVTKDGQVILCHLRWDSRVRTEKSVAPKMEAYELLGNKYPSHFINSTARSQRFTVAAYDETNAFESLIGDIVYFNTKTNGGAWCVVTGINRSETMFGNDTALNLETDSYSEAIEYDL